MYFSTYEAALRRLEALIASGETNIDIGLMQINWRANGWRLPDPARLLQPVHNIETAAAIFSELLERYGWDWRLAFARYHSPRSELGLPYAEAVLRIREWLKSASDIWQALDY
jgi:soluble lytic murein transglycosylase-like protein